MAESQSKEITLTLLPSQAADPEYIKKEIKNRKDLNGLKIKSYRVIRKSIDARKNPVKVNLGIIVSEDKEVESSFVERKYCRLPDNSKQIVIIGAGPAGLFAGLRAIQLGLKPVIIERGKDVDNRRLDIAKISRQGEIDPNSNYCFGEGGAGAFSDGKLFTRSKKRGSVKEVLEILHQFGACEEILISSHPHIGSDKLPTVIKNIREKIKDCGGEVRFNTLMEDVIIENNRATGVRTSDGEVIKGAVFLATGHSSRDVYRMLDSKGITLEPKGIAVGVRLEHPQHLIDQIQYHSKEGRGKYLPAAEYSFVDQANGRGVYSFCMCPGGVIVPAVSDKKQIVVNGMSASARSGKWANSGYVVELHPGDIPGYEGAGIFEMMALQENLEKKFSEVSNGSLKAPAQKIEDFLNGRKSEQLPQTSYAPGIISSDFNEIFPKEINERLKIGLKQIGRRCKKFISNEGLMIGLESRTSSPVRIPRDSLGLNHKEIQDLYPMGEGAGYAGGIVSSAIDGIKCVEAYYRSLESVEKNQDNHLRTPENEKI